MGYGKQIRNLRTERGLSMEQLAEKVGVTFSLIGQIERETRPVSLNLAVDIAIALGCNMRDILEGESENAESRPQA